MTSSELLEIMVDIQTGKIESGLFPTFILRLELFEMFGAVEIRPLLEELKEKGLVREGNTINDKYYEPKTGNNN